MKKLICLIGFMTISMANAQDNVVCSDTYQGSGFVRVIFQPQEEVTTLEGTLGRVICVYGSEGDIEYYPSGQTNYSSTVNQPANFKRLGWEHIWECNSLDPKNCTFNTN